MAAWLGPTEGGAEAARPPRPGPRLVRVSTRDLRTDQCAAADGMRHNIAPMRYGPSERLFRLARLLAAPAAA